MSTKFKFLKFQVFVSIHRFLLEFQFFKHRHDGCRLEHFGVEEYDFEAIFKKFIFPVEIQFFWIFSPILRPLFKAISTHVYANFRAYFFKYPVFFYDYFNVCFWRCREISKAHSEHLWHFYSIIFIGSKLLNRLEIVDNFCIYLFFTFFGEHLSLSKFEYIFFWTFWNEISWPEFTCQCEFFCFFS